MILSVLLPSALVLRARGLVRQQADGGVVIDGEDGGLRGTGGESLRPAASSLSVLKVEG